MSPQSTGLTPRQHAAKRALDLTLGVPMLIAAAPVIAVLWLASALVHRAGGFFRHERIGRNGEAFTFTKLRSMHPGQDGGSTVTTITDARLSLFGRWLRRTKLDELPQLWHVMMGEMSLVGPRPDVAGYADELGGEDRIILSVRPGITGLASLVFRDEERILAQIEDPESFNDTVLYPAKVVINRHYVENYAFGADLRLLLLTVLGRRHPLPESVQVSHPCVASLLQEDDENPIRPR